MDKETLEILRDPELLQSVKRAEEDVRAGRLRALEEFLEGFEPSG